MVTYRTDQLLLKVHINEVAWHLDVESMRPSSEERAKGVIVHHLKHNVI